MSEDRREPSHLAAIGLALIVTFLWSTSWILIRWGLDDEALQPITFAALRYGVASLVLLGWVAARPLHRVQLARLSRSSVARVAALGLLVYALTQGAQFIAIDRQPAATSSVVLSLTPLLVAAFASRSSVEPPSRGQWFGAVLVASGAWLYFSGDLGATTIGMMAAIVGLVANAGSALLGRRVNRGTAVAPVVVTALSMTVGAAALAATGLVAEGWPTITGRATLIIGWLAVVNTAMAFTLWNLSLRRLSAVESAGINNTMLLQIGALAWILLDEGPGPAGIAGMVLVSVGVLVIQLAGMRRVDARPVPMS